MAGGPTIYGPNGDPVAGGRRPKVVLKSGPKLLKQAAENEKKLKKHLLKMKKELENAYDTIQQLQQENKELKDQLREELGA
jgi:hypothetical protein